MAKTVEGIFHPQILKMRHAILKMHAVEGGWGGASVKGAGLGGGDGTPARTSGKTRDGVQKVFVGVLRDVRTCVLHVEWCILHQSNILPRHL